MKKNLSFLLRGPDYIAEELADIVHANLRSKTLARGGEEMLRLRAHEKLQKFLQAGIVTKTGKKYTGVPKALTKFFKETAEMNAKIETFKQTQAALQSKDSQTLRAKVTKNGK